MPAITIRVNDPDKEVNAYTWILPEGSSFVEGSVDVPDGSVLVVFVNEGDISNA